MDKKKEHQKGYSDRIYSESIRHIKRKKLFEKILKTSMVILAIIMLIAVIVVLNVK